jgi:hypothetical protein
VASGTGERTTRPESGTGVGGGQGGCRPAVPGREARGRSFVVDVRAYW